MKEKRKQERRKTERRGCFVELRKSERRNGIDRRLYITNRRIYQERKYTETSN